jgi:hypothetical protein
MPDRVTARQLNRATLARQLLLRREPVDVAEAIRRVGAVQAQEPASPYLALWNRVAGFDPADLDAAFTSHAVVKATPRPMRSMSSRARTEPSCSTCPVRPARPPTPRRRRG